MLSAGFPRPEQFLPHVQALVWDFASAIPSPLDRSPPRWFIAVSWLDGAIGAAVIGRAKGIKLLRLLDLAIFHAGFREDPHRRHHEYGGDDNEYRELRPDRRAAPERQYRGHNQRDGGDSSFDVSRHGNRPCLQLAPTGTAAASSGRRGAPRRFLFTNRVS